MTLYKLAWGLNIPYMCIYLLHRELGDSLPCNLQGPSPDLPVPFNGFLQFLCRTPSTTVMTRLADSPHIQDLDQVQLSRGTTHLERDPTSEHCFPDEKEFNDNCSLNW